jgi:hypothetical protein
MDTTQRAHRAKAIIEDPLFKEAFDVLENAQLSIFTGQACDAEQLMEAHRMVRALRMLKDQLEHVITDGKLLEHRQERRKQHRV